ncbi:MAG: hypothetical protein WD379_06865 [Dehalococcoidia bacterium]
MFRYGLVLALASLVLFVAACNGGGGGSETPSTSGEGTPGADSTESAGEGTASPTESGEASPSPDETPDGEATPEETPSGTPLAEPTAGDAVEDTGVLVECILDQEESVATCGDEGTYQIDPPLGAGYTDCSLYVILEQPAFLTCLGSEFLPTVHYVIPPP